MIEFLEEYLQSDIRYNFFLRTKLEKDYKKYMLYDEHLTHLYEELDLWDDWEMYYTEDDINKILNYIKSKN